jgi:hypothetical protein
VANAGQGAEDGKSLGRDEVSFRLHRSEIILLRRLAVDG